MRELLHHNQKKKREREREPKLLKGDAGKIKLSPDPFPSPSWLLQKKKRKPGQTDDHERSRLSCYSCMLAPITRNPIISASVLPFLPSYLIQLL